jgi:serine/threonine protein phosphatase PrpC
VHIVAQTNVGLVRSRNEDFYIVVPEKDAIIVCDGMGGHPGGDLASRMAAQEVQRLVLENGAGGETEVLLDNDVLRPFSSLIAGVFAADRALRAHGRKHPEFLGMGTTLAALQEKAGVLCAVHVGDSRVYCFRDGKLTQLTQDHSYIATLPEAARASFAGIRNILTRAVGVGEELEVDFTIAPAGADETYMLCTDGLHNFVSEERIAEVLGSQPERTACLATLVEDALRGGGGDNVTLALAWLDAASARSTPRVSGAVLSAASGLRVQLQS